MTEEAPRTTVNNMDTTPTQALAPLPLWSPGPDGRARVPIQIIAADTFAPVEGVRVDITYVGPGADGSFFDVVTDANGLANVDNCIGTFQIHLNPPKQSRFAAAAHQSAEHMLTIQSNGKYFPAVFRIAFHETEVTEMRFLAEDR